MKKGNFQEEVKSLSQMVTYRTEGSHHFCLAVICCLLETGKDWHIANNSFLPLCTPWPPWLNLFFIRWRAGTRAAPKLGVAFCVLTPRTEGSMRLCVRGLGKFLSRIPDTAFYMCIAWHYVIIRIYYLQR